MSNMNPDRPHDPSKPQSPGQSPAGGGQVKDRPPGTDKDRTGQNPGQMGGQHRDDKSHGQPGK
jgi:hypothetical protein